MYRNPSTHEHERHEYETTCGICGFVGHGNGKKPPRCPACGKSW